MVWIFWMELFDNDGVWRTDFDSTEVFWREEFDVNNVLEVIS
jgi:hypothetical protein